MMRISQLQVGSTRWFTGLLALGLFILINLQPAFVATAIWLAATHGHEHHVAVQSDGNRFNVRLSHDHDLGQPAADQHESSLGLKAALFSTHDHDSTDHVLQFNLNEAPDQIRQRNIIIAAQTFAPQVAIAAISSFLPPLISTQSTTATPTESPPPLTAGLLGLRTTVLLI